MKNLLYILLFSFLAIQSSAQILVLNSLSSSPSVIYLDFDGQTVSGTSWNWNGPIVCSASNLSNTQIQEIFNRVSEDYRPFDVNITTDSTVYWNAAPTQRIRVILTSTYQWYGATAGGVSFIGSFNWGDNTPCYVFTSLLQYYPKYIAEAAAHEAGHTLGLKHQSSYNQNCLKLSEYNPGIGSGEIAWAPIMGYGYYNNLTLWHNGSDPYGCNDRQDDLSIISSHLSNGYRTDDFGDSTSTAQAVSFSNNQFIVNGIIERENDKDVFAFSVSSFGNFHADAIPFNTGAGNAGSDLDIQIDLLDSNQNTIMSANPDYVLSASLDTILNPGNYYIRIQGKGNIYAPEYASLGSYSINSFILPGIVLPVHKLSLTATNEKNAHRLSWSIVADEKIKSIDVQVSTNGSDFETIQSVSGDESTLLYQPKANALYYYRIIIYPEHSKSYISNIVSIRYGGMHKPILKGNLIHSDISVSCSEPFTFFIYDMNGKQMSKGLLNPGTTSINASQYSSGIYIIRYENDHSSFTDKLVKQ